MIPPDAELENRYVFDERIVPIFLLISDMLGRMDDSKGG